MAPTAPPVSEPKVSVIIPNYNHAAYLPRRIESVLNQTYKNIEVFLLDDCSLDNSRDIITEYARQDPRVQTVFNTKNSGSTFKQWSKGMGLARGKYIWLAESDDYAALTLLEKLVAKLEADEAVGLAYCDSWFVYEDKQVIEHNPGFYQHMDPTLWTRDFTMPGIELIRKFMSYRNIIPNASAVVLRTSVVRQVGLPNGRLRLVGDWLYWASLLAVSKAAFVAEPLNYFRFHTNNVRSKSGSNGLAILETVKLLSVMRQYGPPDEPLATKAVDELLEWWQYNVFQQEEKFTLKRHGQLYRAFSRLDSNARKNINSFLFNNNLSGARQFLGDGWLYPWLKRLKERRK